MVGLLKKTLYDRGYVKSFPSLAAVGMVSMASAILTGEALGAVNKVQSIRRFLSLPDSTVRTVTMQMYVCCMLLA